MVKIPLGRQGLTFTAKYLWGYHILTNKGIIFFEDRNEMLSLVMQFVTNQNYSLFELILSLLFAVLYGSCSSPTTCSFPSLQTPILEYVYTFWKCVSYCFTLISVFVRSEAFMVLKIKTVVLVALYSENWGSKLCRNVGTHQQNYVVY